MTACRAASNLVTFGIFWPPEDNVRAFNVDLKWPLTNKSVICASSRVCRFISPLSWCLVFVIMTFREALSHR